MKKIVCVLLSAVLLAGLTACGSSEQNIAKATTKDDLTALIQQYSEAGDFSSALSAAEKMIELFPDDSAGYELKVDALIGILKQDYDSFSSAVAGDLEKTADAGAYRTMLLEKLAAANLEVTVPFISDYQSADEANTVGNTGLNLQGPVWVEGASMQTGVFASQGDWIYYADLQSDFALCKMRSDGSGKQTLLEDGACQINVVGDWIYFSNITDQNALYKVRTDGSEKTKLSSDACVEICVVGDAVFYTIGKDITALYRMSTDGADNTKLADDALCIFSDGQWLYYSTQNEQNLFRVPVNGAEAQAVLSGVWHALTYVQDGLIYYLSDNNGLVIMKMQPDGTEKTQLFKYDGKINSFVISEGRLVISVRTKEAVEGILAYQMDTMEKTLQVDNFTCDTLWMDAAGNILTPNFDENHVLYQINWETGAMEKFE